LSSQIGCHLKYTCSLLDRWKETRGRLTEQYSGASIRPQVVEGSSSKLCFVSSMEAVLSWHVLARTSMRCFVLIGDIGKAIGFP
jgi:hypothetical protein